MEIKNNHHKSNYKSFVSSYVKIWKILNNKERYKASLLFILLLIGSAFEAIGVGLILPILSILSGGALVNNIALELSHISPTLSFSNTNIVLVFVCTLLGFYFFKTFYLSYLSIRQSEFIFNLLADLSQRLYLGYLKKPYSFHLKRNSGELVRNILSEVGQFITALSSLITLFSELIVMFGIGLLLVVIEPVGSTISICFLILIGSLFYYFTKGRVLQWGKARHHHEGLRIQHLQQGLGGVREVKLNRSENYFLWEYAQHDNASAHAGKCQAIFLSLPRLWLELFAVFGITIICLVLTFQGKPVEALIPVIGMFAAAGFRVMPSINRVLGALQSLQYLGPTVNTLHHELSELVDSIEADEASKVAFLNNIVIEKLSYSYENSSSVVLDNINLTINRGEMVGFVGESGAGKSTLIDLILGLLSPTSGLVLVDNKDISDNLRAWQSKIGYVPQCVYLTDDTLRKNIAFGIPLDQINNSMVLHAVRQAQLSKFIENLPNGLDTMVGERGVRLSGGQLQRIGIARALYSEPEVLIFDEATSALDLATEANLMDGVYSLKKSKTIIVIAHRSSALKNCDRTYTIKSGGVFPIN